MTDAAGRRQPVFGRGSWLEASRVADILRKETIGGVLLLIGAVVALVWANSPWSAGYESVRAYPFGPAAWHLHLPVAVWATDGLLAIFFFVAGLELKREFVAGELRDPRRAAVPVAAALGGVLVHASGVHATVAGVLLGFAVPVLRSDRGDHVKIAVLAGSVTAAPLAAVVLRLRNRTHRRIHEAETADDDHDGIPNRYR